MAVDRQWLESVRRKNRAKFGMDTPLPAGMSGLGVAPRPSSQDLVQAVRLERDVRTQQIHEGRFDRTDPNKPTEGSVESIAQSLQQGGLPTPQPLPAPVVWIGGLATAGVLGLLAYAIYKRA